MNVAVKFNPLEAPMVAAEADRRAMSVTEFVHSATLRMLAQPMTTSERDEVIANLTALNWSSAEIATRLGISQTTVRARINRLQGSHA